MSSSQNKLYVVYQLERNQVQFKLHWFNRRGNESTMMIEYFMWDWVLRHRRQRTQLRFSHVGNSFSVKLTSLARTLQTLKVKYFECLHLSQRFLTSFQKLDCDQPRLLDQGTRSQDCLEAQGRHGNVCYHHLFFSIHCKIDNFKVFEELKKTGI